MTYNLTSIITQDDLKNPQKNAKAIIYGFHSLAEYRIFHVQNKIDISFSDNAYTIHYN